MLNTCIYEIYMMNTYVYMDNIYIYTHIYMYRQVIIDHEIPPVTAPRGLGESLCLLRQGTHPHGAQGIHGVGDTGDEGGEPHGSKMGPRLG